MQPLVFLLLIAGLPTQPPSLSGTVAPAAVAQQVDRDSSAHRTLAVLDSLLRLPPPRSLTTAQRHSWTEQTRWLKSLRERLQNLLSLVVAPAKVPTPAPIDEKNLLAFQAESEKESLKFDLSTSRLKARHEAAMASIRNIK